MLVVVTNSALLQRGLEPHLEPEVYPSPHRNSSEARSPFLAPALDQHYPWPQPWPQHFTPDFGTAIALLVMTPNFSISHRQWSMPNGLTISYCLANAPQG